ncbi:hypothetical protein WK39_31680 [Burkholderia cepacia]|nr:hypothetical protein WK39_31680 [Burkholderia cepacia]KVS66626.1 hypothetical protein WK40_11260 [Burkholderia cepacia]
MRRIRCNSIWTLVDRAQPLALQAATYAFGTRRLALGTQLPHDTRTDRWMAATAAFSAALA